MKGILRSGSELVQNIKGSRSRKTLQPLQPSANDYNILVPSPSMVKRGEKDVTKSSESIFKIPQVNNITGKENATSRRSKRKKVLPNEQIENEPSKEDAEPSTSKRKSKLSGKAKKASVAKKSSRKTADPNQSSLDSYIATIMSEKVDLSETVDKTTVTDDKTTVTDEEVTLFVAKSFCEEVDILTSDVTPESYWKELAEQRRIALEKALYENSQLSDQLEVLAGENARLKSTLKEFEKITEIMNASFE